MKDLKVIIALFFITTSALAQVQKSQKWTIFYNQDSTKVGYKGANGTIEVEPIETIIAPPYYFDNIIAVIQLEQDKIKSYYLSKSGKEIARDSLYYFDNQPDCEREGFIRFKDPISQKVGLINALGQVVIPAQYDELSKVNNHLLVGLLNAKRVVYNKENSTGDSHFYFKGGKRVLIDTTNTILIENFDSQNKLNLFTLQISDSPTQQSNRISFEAKDNSYYSFIDDQKDFSIWLKEDLLKNLNKQKLLSSSFDSIVWQSNKGWKTTDKQEFIDNNYQAIKECLLQLTNEKNTYAIYRDGLNPYLFDPNTYREYFDNCQDSKQDEFPTFSLVINMEENSKLTQNFFEFLLTKEGYKLITVTIRNRQLL
ncbi:hypothetical protein ACYSNM_03710 [Myroides sp. LJL116]